MIHQAYQNLAKNILDFSKYCYENAEDFENHNIKNLGCVGYLEKQFGNKLPNNESTDKLTYAMELYQHIKKCQTVYQHPNFNAFFPSNSTTASALGGLHQNLDNFYSDSQNTNPDIEKFEIKILEAIRKLMGLPEHLSYKQGGFCSLHPTVGNSSLMALNLAKKIALEREITKNPSKTKKEILSRLVGYYPSTSHSHCLKALSLVGVKHNRSIPSKFLKDWHSFNIDLNTLESTIAEDKENGLIPFFCMGVLGATSTGSNDDLRSMSIISRQNEMFFMIDAAWGGNFLADPNTHIDLEEQMKEYAARANFKYGEIGENEVWNFKDVDFITINMSKMGLTGMDTCVCYTSKNACIYPEIKGFFNKMESDQHKQLGTLTDHQYTRLPGNPKQSLLKLHYMLQSYGKEGFINHIRLSIKQAKKMEDFIRQDPRLEVIPERKYSMVTFRIKNQSSEQSEVLTRKLLDKIDACDRMFMVGGKVDGIYFIRFSTTSKAQDHNIQELWSFISLFTREVLQEKL